MFCIEHFLFLFQYFLHVSQMSWPKWLVKYDKPHGAVNWSECNSST